MSEQEIATLVVYIVSSASLVGLFLGLMIAFLRGKG